MSLAWRRALFDVQLILRAAVLLPPRVAGFYVRAHRLARRSSDEFSLIAPARPEDLRRLLKEARGRDYVVELGTGTAWAAISLALADPERRVVSYDPVRHPGTAGYLALAGREALERLELRQAAAESGPQASDPSVDLLFVDIGGHSRSSTVSAFVAWQDALAPDAIVVFHDYVEAFPGVPMAVAQLGLEGHVAGESLFVSVPGGGTLRGWTRSQRTVRRGSPFSKGGP